MDAAGLPALVDAIRHLHGAEATHLESVFVRETWQGATVWEGDVEVFALAGHPTATRAYAWSHAVDGGNGRRRFVAVLHAPPVDSPVAAVLAAIGAEYRQRQN